MTLCIVLLFYYLTIFNKISSKDKPDLCRPTGSQRDRIQEGRAGFPLLEWQSQQQPERHLPSSLKGKLRKEERIPKHMEHTTHNSQKSLGDIFRSLIFNRFVLNLWYNWAYLTMPTKLWVCKQFTKCDSFISSTSIKKNITYGSDTILHKSCWS